MEFLHLLFCIVVNLFLPGLLAGAVLLGAYAVWRQLWRVA